jgi:DNA-binding LacI/PurR family transcriptional regulator
MRAILDAGLRIPEDVAVVGCGNLSCSDFLRVPRSSVDQGSLTVGTLAEALALKLAHYRPQDAPKAPWCRRLLWCGRGVFAWGARCKKMRRQGLSRPGEDGLS